MKLESPTLMWYHWKPKKIGHLSITSLIFTHSNLPYGSSWECEKEATQPKLECHASVIGSDGHLVE